LAKKKNGLPRSDGGLSKKGESQPRETKAGLEEMEPAVDVLQEWLDKMDNTDLEANGENSEAVAVHQEVPNEEAEVETVGALEGRNGDWRLAAMRRGRQEKRTQGDGRSRQKLAATRGRLTRRAVPALRKGRRRRPGKTTGNGITERSRRQQLRLASEMAFNKTLGQPLELEVAKRAGGISIRLRKVSQWASWRSQLPPKRKKRRQKHSPRKRRNGGTPVVDQLLDNDSEKSNCTTAVTKQLLVKSNRGTVFSVWSVTIGE
jgi:hypothetical protein